MKKPMLGIHLGDANGVGPEIVAKVAASGLLVKQCTPVIVSSKDTWEAGLKRSKVTVAYKVISNVEDIDRDAVNVLDTKNLSAQDITVGECTAIAGKAVGDNLMSLLDLCKGKKLDGFVFAPFNKTSLKMGGYSFESENKLFAHYFQVSEHVCEVNISGKTWTSRVTSHIPLKDVASTLNEENITGAISLIDKLLKDSGNPHPKIGVAALNPHAGEHGTCGREEIEIIAPAVEKVRAKGIDAEGPVSADIVFIRALKNNEYDAVVTMYHDQGQIALKLNGFDSGVTYHGGLPVTITTPAHGSAFDIAGKNIASTHAFEAALRVASDTVYHKLNT